MAKARNGRGSRGASISHDVCPPETRLPVHCRDSALGRHQGQTASRLDVSTEVFRHRFEIMCHPALLILAVTFGNVSVMECYLETRQLGPLGGARGDER